MQFLKDVSRFIPKNAPVMDFQRFGDQTALLYRGQLGMFAFLHEARRVAIRGLVS